MRSYRRRPELQLSVSVRVVATAVRLAWSPLRRFPEPYEASLRAGARSGERGLAHYNPQEIE